MKEDGLVSSKSDRVATFLSTHPDPIDRISKTNDRLTKAGIPVKDYTSSGEGIYKEEYQTHIKSHFPKSDKRSSDSLISNPFSNILHTVLSCYSSMY